MWDSYWKVSIYYSIEAFVIGTQMHQLYVTSFSELLNFNRKTLQYNICMIFFLQDSVYLTDRGQNINKRPNIVYVSTNNTKTWKPLHEFVDVSMTVLQSICVSSPEIYARGELV